MMENSRQRENSGTQSAAAGGGCGSTESKFLEIKIGSEPPENLIPTIGNRQIDETAEEFLELVADIRAKGVLVPLIVTEERQILAGHRRRLAAISAGLARVPVIYRELRKGEQAADIFLSENQQRKNLTLLEEAVTLERLRRETGLSGRDLARRVNRHPEYVRNCLRLLELSPAVQEHFHLGRLPASSIKIFSKLTGEPELQLKFANLYISGKLTLPRLERAVGEKTGMREMSRSIEKPPAERRAYQTDKSKGLETTVRHASRPETMANLNANSAKTISLHTVRQVLETACCYCGMQNEQFLCRTCPLLVFANGLIGRASGGTAGFGGNYDEEDF